MKDVLSDKLMSMEDVLVLLDTAVKCVGKDTLDPDTFLRLNIALDHVLDERDAEGTLVTTPPLAGADATSIGDDAEGFYNIEFKQLATSGIVTSDALLSWSEVLADGAISRAQATQMYQGMPKEVVGETEGISEKSFLGLQRNDIRGVGRL
jgi:hypothetical protein